MWLNTAKFNKTGGSKKVAAYLRYKNWKHCFAFLTHFSR